MCAPRRHLFISSTSLLWMEVNFLNQKPCIPSWPGVIQLGILFMLFRVNRCVFPFSSLLRAVLILLSYCLSILLFYAFLVAILLLFLLFLLLLLIIIIIYSFRVFHISVGRWFFTGVWVTASLLKSPGLVSGFWPFLAMLSFGQSLPVCQLPSPPGLLIIL